MHTVYCINSRATVTLWLHSKEEEKKKPQQTKHTRFFFLLSTFGQVTLRTMFTICVLYFCFLLAAAVVCMMVFCAANQLKNDVVMCFFFSSSYTQWKSLFIPRKPTWNVISLAWLCFWFAACRWVFAQAVCAHRVYGVK